MPAPTATTAAVPTSATSADPASGTTQTFTDPDGTMLTFTAGSYTARKAGANAELVPASDRIATISVKACLKSSPDGAVALSWTYWTLIFADGAGVQPLNAYSPRDFPKPLYPNDSDTAAVKPGQCRTGLIPFDIPSGQAGNPVRIEYSVGSTILDWKA